MIISYSLPFHLVDYPDFKVFTDAASGHTFLAPSARTIGRDIDTAVDKCMDVVDSHLRSIKLVAPCTIPGNYTFKVGSRWKAGL